MANRVLLLLAMASRNDPNSSPKILSETAGWSMFLFTPGLHLAFQLHSFHNLFCWVRMSSIISIVIVITIIV